jgi:hypothetical protein
MDLAEEFRLAREERDRALAHVQQMREQLECAKKEYVEVRAEEIRGERQIKEAADKLTHGLQQISLSSACPDKYLVEYHANIGCYNCYLFIENISDFKEEDLKLDLQFPQLLLRKNDEIYWEIKVEKAIDLDASSIILKEDHVYLRLPFHKNDQLPSNNIGMQSFNSIHAEEVKVENFNSIVCRFCDTELRNGDTQISKVLPLPSANWMDMLEFWGAGNGGFDHIPRGEIVAQCGRIYVGASYIMVHSKDLKENGIEVSKIEKCQYGDRLDAWVKVECKRCTSKLGCLHDNTSTYKLYKHAISVESKDKNEESIQAVNIFGEYDVDNIFTSEILDCIEADGVFRYNLECDDKSPETLFVPLQLQVLSWETLIKTSDRPSFRRVIKTLFRSEEVNVNKEDNHAKQQARQILFDEEICMEISAHLKTSTDLLPLSLRKFNNMNVGYLSA